MRNLILTCVAVMAVGAFCRPTSAAIVNSALFPSVVNQIQDTDFERLVNNVGVNPDIIDVGDVLEAIVTYDTANITNLKGTFGSSYELTAHIMVEVATKTSLGGGLFNFTFTNGFADGLTAIKLYEEAAATAGTVFDASVAPDGAGGGIDRATTGVLVSTFGLAAGSDDFWVAFGAADDISVFRSLGDPALQGGDFHLGVSLLTNPGGLAILTEANGGGVATLASGALTVNDVVGNGSLKVPAAGVNAGWDVQTDTTASFVATPEPSSLVLLAIGSTFVVGLRRRKIAG